MPEKRGTVFRPDSDAGNLFCDDWVPEMAASYGPKQTVVLSKPVEKRGSKGADSSVMTPAEEFGDLDHRKQCCLISFLVLDVSRDASA